MDGPPNRPAPRPRPPFAGPRLIDQVLAPLRACLTEWPAVLPSQIGDPVKPLKIGIAEDLAALLRPDEAEAGTATLNTVLRRFCRSEAYVRALSLPGACRHDLAGNPVEPVSALHAIPRRPIRGWSPPPSAAPPSLLPEAFAMTVKIKALKVTAIVPPSQLKPAPAGAEVVMTIEAGAAITATARLDGEAYRQALAAIAELGAENAVVAVRGRLARPGEIEAAEITVRPRKPKEAKSASGDS